MLEKAYGIRNRRYMSGVDILKKGHESINHKPQRGRPASITSSHVTEFRELLELDRRITIHEISYKVDCSTGTVHDILHNKLNMRWVYARWIPKMSGDQKK